MEAIALSRGLHAAGWAILILLLFGCGRSQAPQFKSTDVTGAEFGRDFALTDHDGKPRRLADFKGRVVVVFFGFTHCPDVCPTALAQMAKTLKSLDPEDARRVQVLFITVDPERDSPAVLRDYVTAFNPEFLALTGSVDDIARTTREFKVLAAKTAESSPGNYSVDHSTQTFVYDANNRLRLFVSHSKIEEVLGHDLKQLLNAS